MKTILITLLIGTVATAAFSQADLRKALRSPYSSPTKPRVEGLTQEQEIIVMTILGEARGEKELGMYAVACVIKQRMDNGKRNGISICTQFRQFSVWNSRDSDKKLRKLLNGSKEHLYAITLAKAVTTENGLDKRATNFADHYCTLKTNPYWAKGKKPVKIIGNHKFFKLN
jgi:N-acetylmuramoyl-L-alanine amidase